MLAVKRSSGVAPEVNEESGGSVAPQRALVSSKFFFKKIRFELEKPLPPTTTENYLSTSIRIRGRNLTDRNFSYIFLQSQMNYNSVSLRKWMHSGFSVPYEWTLTNKAPAYEVHLRELVVGESERKGGWVKTLASHGSLMMWSRTTVLPIMYVVRGKAMLSDVYVLLFKGSREGYILFRSCPEKRGFRP